MTFLEALQIYLRRVARAPGGQTAPPDVDPAKARGYLIAALERLDQKPELPGAGDVSGMLQAWQKDDRIVTFATRLARLLREGFGQDASQDEVDGWVGVGIARQLGHLDTLSTRVRTIELDRLARRANEDLFGQGISGEVYAAEIRATRANGGTIAITQIGRVLLELTGRDAIRWLLHVEAIQSIGPGDPWRISREMARELAAHPRRHFHEDDGDDPEFPYSWSILRRLATLGLIRIDDEGFPVTVLEVVPSAVELLTEIGEDHDSPLSLLARTVVADLTASAGQWAHAGTARDAMTGAEATARQSRLVAHEIRNALLPVKSSLNSLYREILLGAPISALQNRRGTIDHGIDAIFRFVEDLVHVAALAATPPEPLDARSAIQDAISAIDFPSKVTLEQDIPPQLPLISGHRARIVNALVNILRNAIQSDEAKISRVRVGAEAVEGARAIRITIDDNGPGVPEAMRRAIFEEGISLRPGGSGLGLALVREVFEKEMKGMVTCESSGLGGARFVVRLPATGAV